MRRTCRLLLFAAMLVAAPAWAQDWGVVANISATMGVNANRLCYGEASRGDIGCPADAPLVSGSTVTGRFVGDGSGLTGVTAASGDRITSGTAQVIANSSSNSISITEAGVTTGYYYNGVWVAKGVSTTGPISSTNGFFSGNVGLGTIPGGKLDVSGTSYFGNDINNRVRIQSGLIAMQDFSDPGRKLEIQATRLSVGSTNSRTYSALNTALINALSSTDGDEVLRLGVNTYTNGYVVMRQASVNSFNMSFYQNGNPQLLLNSGGNIGIGIQSTSIPSTSLHISGTIRIANGGEACDTNRSGAIRYTNSTFQVCYGTGGWANLADASSTVATADRITSGTAQVIANGNSNSISITEAGVTTGYFYGGKLVAGGVSTTGMISSTGLYVTGTVGIGTNAPRSPLEVVDGMRLTLSGNSGWTTTLNTDTSGNLVPSGNIKFASTSSNTIYNGATNQSYYLVDRYGHTIATSPFPNANVAGLSYNGAFAPTLNIYHQKLLSFTGTVTGSGIVTATGLYTAIGDSTSNANSIVGLYADVTSGTNVNALRYPALLMGGNVGIGTIAPNARLEVSGSISATTLQLADSPATVCGPATYGTTKFINGRPYYCRP
ncbi:hypothetical protein NKJ06_22745 [Mesorhizobium sp. M0293]|uniref:hypothetical protein n=1 Tax=Mesorhizobium sp. M0293 TaxID=2956930 RepID=UPI00333A8535